MEEPGSSQTTGHSSPHRVLPPGQGGSYDGVLTAPGLI